MLRLKTREETRNTFFRRDRRKVENEDDDEETKAADRRGATPRAEMGWI